ncbi:MAG TPA: hypothetical protein VNR62_08710 [Cellulomonas sp.]|nr:hypothetical protein [Cellulomonas sp.]
MPVDQVQYTRIPAFVPGLVEHAWVARHDGTTREILLPDGRGLLQVILGEGGTLVAVATGTELPDATGVRGLMTRPVVRIARGAGVRLGLQLHPSALASLGVATLVDTWADVDTLVGSAALAAAALEAGEDGQAVGILVDELRSRRQADDAETVQVRELLSLIDERDGAITVPELARAAEVTVSDVHRWAVRHLGLPPADYLSAVRFSVFVRRAVGPGVVEPEAVLRALRWYARAGYPPREVERTAGMSPVELQRVDERIGALLDHP